MTRIFIFQLNTYGYSLYVTFRISAGTRQRSHSQEDSHVEAGSNTFTVALRIIEGDEKGTIHSVKILEITEIFK
jgi:hypothetical protein